MTTDPNIPPEALEAAARAICETEYGPCDGGGPSKCECTYWQAHARAACLAMLKAWPGMHTHEWHRPWLGGMSGADIILPLPQEKQNAEG